MATTKYCYDTCPITSSQICCVQCPKYETCEDHCAFLCWDGKQALKEKEEENERNHERDKA